MKYRIVPGSLYNYELERKGWLFWYYCTMSNSYTHLVQIVRNCGGTLINPERETLVKGNVNA